VFKVEVAHAGISSTSEKEERSLIFALNTEFGWCTTISSRRQERTHEQARILEDRWSNSTRYRLPAAIFRPEDAAISKLSGLEIFSAQLTTSAVAAVGNNDDLSFSRKSAGTLLDHQHTCVRAKPGELRFEGARRIENLVSSSENFNLYEGHENFLIRPGVTDPSATTRASTITARAITNLYIQPLPPSLGIST